MENLLTSNSNKNEEFNRKAKSIQGLVIGINYEFFSSVELESLIFLTNHIREIPSEEIMGFRIVKYTESWFIFRKLKEAYSFRNLQEVIKILLIEYQHYETLAVLDF